MIAIRGLPAAEIGPPELLTREQLAIELATIFDEEYPEDEQEIDNFSLRALGLLDPDQDVAELQLQLLGDQVLGLLRRRRQAHGGGDRCRPGCRGQADLRARVHARPPGRGLRPRHARDRCGGRGRPGPGAHRAHRGRRHRHHAVLGASSTSRPRSSWRSAAGRRSPTPRGIPAWMVNQLQFPYNEGSLWAAACAGDPTVAELRGDRRGVRRIRPRRRSRSSTSMRGWRARRRSPSSRLDLASALGDEWEEVDATPIGEATISDHARVLRCIDRGRR